MSLAARTREAVRDRPFLYAALRAGIVNYTAAANWLVGDSDVDGDPDAVATALRRFAQDLPPYDGRSRRASVSMRSGVGIDADGSDSEDALFGVGDTAVVPEGSKTAIVATGEVDYRALSHVLTRLSCSGVEVHAASVASETLVLLVDRREGVDAVRIAESALDAVPKSGS